MSLAVSSRLGDLPVPPPPCGTCGFQLWRPIAPLSVTDVGLYDDARFPGRMIVALRGHYDHFDELPGEVAAALMVDVQRISGILRKGLGADRVNVAILGNQEPHVHAHVIPRYSVREPLPKNSPWQDPRTREALEPVEREDLIQRIGWWLHHSPSTCDMRDQGITNLASSACES